jgi:hypothetical protein
MELSKGIFHLGNKSRTKTSTITLLPSKAVISHIEAAKPDVTDTKQTVVAQAPHSILKKQKNTNIYQPPAEPIL